MGQICNFKRCARRIDRTQRVCAFKTRTSFARCDETHTSDNKTSYSTDKRRDNLQKRIMEQSNSKSLGPLRAGYSSKTSSKIPSHFSCPSTPKKSVRGYDEGKNIHDLGKVSRFALLLSPENVSPQRLMNFTKEIKNACMTPTLGSAAASSRRNLYPGATPTSTTGTPSSNSSSSCCEEVVRDHRKWETLKEHMRRGAGGYTPMGLGENLNDLLDSASNHQRSGRGGPTSPRQV